VYVEIPTDSIDVVKDSNARNAAHKAKCAINRLIDQLYRSVFDHNSSPYLSLII
jgi:hypothetical protein